MTDGQKLNDSLNDRDDNFVNQMSFLKEFEDYDKKLLYEDRLLHSTAILGSTAATTQNPQLRRPFTIE